MVAKDIQQPKQVPNQHIVRLQSTRVGQELPIVSCHPSSSRYMLLNHLSIAIPGTKRRSISEKLLIELLASLAGLTVPFPPVCSAKASDTEFNVNKAVIPSVDAFVFTLFKKYVFFQNSLLKNLISVVYNIPSTSHNLVTPLKK